MTYSVLYLTDDFKPDLGGAAEHVHQVTRHLAAQGVDASVMVFVNPDKPRNASFDETCGYRIHRLRSAIGSGGWWKRPWTRAGLWRHIVRAARESRADCLIMSEHHVPLKQLHIWMAAALLRLPVVMVAHGESITLSCSPETPWCTRMASRWSLRSAARVICVSRSTAAIVAAQGVRPDRIAVTYNGIDLAETDAYIDAPAASSERVRAAFPRNAPTIFSVARMDMRKGADKVIEAMPRILDAVPGARFVLGGSGRDSQQIKELARRSPAARSITFLGRLSDDEVRECYTRCDVFVMVSRAGEKYGEVEGFGLVYLEAAAFGKPAVAGSLGGAPEAVSDGETGLVVNPLDSDQVADAVIRLLTNPDDARRMGARGRRRAERVFKWSNTAAQFKSCIRDVVESSR